MISISNLAKSYGDRTLFSGASFQLNAGERYGLVGANGSGKPRFKRVLLKHHWVVGLSCLFLRI